MGATPNSRFGCSLKQFVNVRDFRYELARRKKERLRLWHEFDLSDLSVLDSLPDQPCCYVIYLNDNLSYVGSTESLKKRMKCHFMQMRYSSLVYFKQSGKAYVSVRIKAKFPRRFGDWLMTEIRLIKRLMPPLNKKGKLCKPWGAM